MEKLINAAKKQNTETILACLTQIGGGQVNPEQRMVRAALIEVFIQREGEEAGDELMDKLGM